jgi:L-lysine exporter family protein LysE/ArgO
MVMLANTIETAFQAGLIFGTASILSVGPNNLMLVREGLIRGRTGLVATLVWGSYLLLLVLAYLLADSVEMVGPGLRNTLTWLGLAALSWFALQALRTAFSARPAPHLPQAAMETGRSCIKRVLAVVWFNPLTYLELFLIPAAICGTFAAADARLQFLAALVLMASLCCYGYALGGNLVSLVLRQQGTLRAFDFISGLMLSMLAISMATSLAISSP